MFRPDDHPRASDGQFTTKPADEADGGTQALRRSEPVQVQLDDLRLDSPIVTVVSSETVEQRGKRALEAVRGVPVFSDEHEVAGTLWMVRDKLERKARWGREIESWTIGEALATYLDVFERQAHDDLMADRITYRQYSNRCTRLRNKILRR